MRIEVSHDWAATGGNHPDERPFYCPLDASWARSVQTLRDMRRRLPEDADEARIIIASMAWRIPEDDTTLWYRLTARASSSWTPAAPGADPAGLLAAARAELDAVRRIDITGDHPGTRPDPAALTTPRIGIAWIAAEAGTDPNDAGADPDRLHWAGRVGAGYDQALHDWRAHRADLARAGLRPDTGPADGADLWASLRAEARTPWLPGDAHIDPHETGRALADALITALDAAGAAGRRAGCHSSTQPRIVTEITTRGRR